MDADIPEHQRTDSTDEHLLTRLAAGYTISEACGIARCGRSYAHGRLRDPAFRARINELRSEMIDRAMGQLADGAADAVIALRNIVRGGGVCAECGKEFVLLRSYAVVVAAAGKILERYLGKRETVELTVEEPADPREQVLEERVRARAQAYVERLRLQGPKQGEIHDG